MTEIERLAQIAWESHELPGGAKFTLFSEMNARWRESRCNEVRAMLKAMREPSEETYQAGWRAFEKLPIIPQNIWQVMIDHILSEE